jgi:hypothetical protein
MFLGKILFLDDELGRLAEERTEKNKEKRDEELDYIFDVRDVYFYNKESIKKGDVVWFSLVKPCGGKEMVDSIKKPIFPCS